MVVQPTWPGVYVEEIPSGVHTITAVSTATAAFIGRAKEGPVKKATRIQSLSDFERVFGEPLPDSELSIAVRLFFQNGGTDCYILRLVKEGTGQKASVILKNELLADVLRFEAKEIGTWGNTLALEVDYDTSRPDDTYHLRVYRLNIDGSIKDIEEHLNLSADPDSPRFAPDLVTQESKLVDCKMVHANKTDYKSAATQTGYSESRRPFDATQAGLDELANLFKATATGTNKLQISVDGSPFSEVDLQDAFPVGSNEAAIQTAIESKINSALHPTLANSVDVTFASGPGGTKLLRFESATTDKKSIMIQPASSNDVAKVLTMGTDSGGIERSRFGFMRPAPTGTFFDISKINDLSDIPQNHFDTINLEGNAIELQSKLITTGAPTDKWYKSSGGNNDGIREKFGIIAREISDAGIGWQATVAGSRLILKKRSGQNNDSHPVTTSPNDIGTHFKASVKLYSSGTGLGTYIGTTVTGLEGEPPDLSSYNKAFSALDTVDIFNLMVIPRDSNLIESDYRSLIGPASVYCKNHRAFLLIDPPTSWKEVNSATDQSIGIRSLRVGVVKDHAAVYFPNLKVRENGILKTIGPSGAIAGLYSRMDSSGGGGVWSAPAGVTAEILGISDVDVSLTDRENGVLNKEGVDCIRKFASGIVSWGARTMDGADDFTSEWKYIPIRRLALMIAESLFRGTKYAVFKGNDEPLWADIRRNVRAFMMGLFRQGAFQGGSPDTAFFVKCDSETTTQADRNLGIVNIIVGFAPLKPAEFVIIKIQQMAGEL